MEVPGKKIGKIQNNNMTTLLQSVKICLRKEWFDHVAIIEDLQRENMKKTRLCDGTCINGIIHSPYRITFRYSLTVFIIEVFYHQVGVSIMSRSKVSNHSTRDAQGTGHWKREESNSSSHQLTEAHT